MLSIKEHVDLTPFNTFGVTAYARFFMHIKTIQDLQAAIRSANLRKLPYLILGGGSNILFTKDYDGTIIKSDLKGIEVLHQDNKSTTIEVAAGETWDDLVSYCVAHNWGGIENLSLIPGTVGAAPIQNIGAYGIEIKDVIEKVSAVDMTTGQVRIFSKSECQFAYRTSVFKAAAYKKYFISSVTLRLTNNAHQLITSYGNIRQVLLERSINKPTIKHIRDIVISIRKEKLPDPVTTGNAGSFFKNPIVKVEVYEALLAKYPEIPGYLTENQMFKIPAAWLIEQCEWKGARYKNAGVHARQPLVLVNLDQAKGIEIYELSKKIQHAVLNKFGISLSCEVNIL